MTRSDRRIIVGLRMDPAERHLFPVEPWKNLAERIVVRAAVTF
jgi:hypothetical protein